MSGASACTSGDFYPRPPRGGRRPCAHCSPLGGRISIHALREEGDEGRGGQFCSLDIFLSTPSARRATWHHRHVYGPQRISIHALREEGDNTSNTTTAPARKISIHALREEGDMARWVRLRSPAYFYPRPPRGGRLRSAASAWYHEDFYPRPPRGGRRTSSKSSICST